MSERLLYEERQWFPWRFAALSTLGIAALCLLGGLLARPTLGVAGLALLLAAGCSVLFFGYVWIMCRTSPVRLDERALRPPWRPPVPLELIDTARIVEGRELKRIRAELGRW